MAESMSTRSSKRRRCCTELIQTKPEDDVSSEWTKEEDILSKDTKYSILRYDPKLYDQPKLYEGYIDDNAYSKDEMPFRYITNWFLSTLNQSSTTRMPLPQKETGFSRLYLYGELEPNPRRVHLSKQDGTIAPVRPLKLVVTKPKCWTIDMSDSLRGIWIKSNLAWYYLKQPCTHPISFNGRVVTQEDLHVNFRAHFGLLSNIYDMMGELHEEVRRSQIPSYVNVHKNLTPEESHRKLCPTQEDLEQNPDLNSEPFDMDLLRRVPDFVRRHLKQFSKSLKSNCAFMVGLSTMKHDLEAAKKRGDGWALDLDKFDYLSSAKTAERRSRRYPWGEKIHKGQVTNYLNGRLEVGAVKMDRNFNELYILGQSKSNKEDSSSEEEETFFPTNTSDEKTEDSDASSASSKKRTAEEKNVPKLPSAFDEDSELIDTGNISVFEALNAVGVLEDFASQHNDRGLARSIKQIREQLEEKHRI